MLRFSADLNKNLIIDADEDITYTLVGTKLHRNGQIVAYDIEAVGFAYAFDDDGDGELDKSANGNVIWAIDSDSDGQLNKELDTNDDGIINANDIEGGIDLSNIDIAKIRGVRIWLLANTREPIEGSNDYGTYVVGANHRGPADDNWEPTRKRVLLTTTTYCRNMGI